ncbi:MAG: GNAT family N-acetyltransferase [Clostridiales bacterium]|nr:GNAT family N-acetyltransferase [Clostridiales bacterium]
MKPKLTLHVPTLRDMPYRQRLLSQTETMSYNAHRPYDAPNYDPETGCIDFPMADWRFWRDVWLRREPERYSAYLLEEGAGFVGEVCYYADWDTGRTMLGVLVEAEHRGRGVGTEGLRLIAARALGRPEIDKVYVDAPSRDGIVARMCASAGFAREGSCMALSGAAK